MKGMTSNKKNIWQILFLRKIIRYMTGSDCLLISIVYWQLLYYIYIYIYINITWQNAHMNFIFSFTFSNKLYSLLEVYSKYNPIHSKYTMSNKRSNDALHCSCQPPSLCVLFVNLALVCSSVHHHHHHCSFMLGCDFVYLKLRRMIIFLIKIYWNFFLLFFSQQFINRHDVRLIHIYVENTWKNNKKFLFIVFLYIWMFLPSFNSRMMIE